MPLTGVNSIHVQPEKLGDFEKEIVELARRAANAKDRFRWTAHQSIWGEPNHFSFAYQVESFADLEKLGTVQELVQRCYGSEADERSEETNECVLSMEHVILVDRSDLSYPPHAVEASAYPYAAVTRIRSRPGHTEALEELIRKLSEATAKIEDAAHLASFQNYFGDLSEYWVVRPLTELGQLDTQLVGPTLLEKAFGPGEGGLLWRAGNEAVESAHRELLSYRPEMSNPG